MTRRSMQGANPCPQYYEKQGGIRMNELDKLREMLKKAGIPYEDEIEPIDKITNELMIKYPDIAEGYGEARKWRRNQVIYGRTGHNDWKWDGIWQYGSYGAAEGMIESYGELGVDEHHEPKVVTAEEAFAVIKADYDRRQKMKEDCISRQAAIEEIEHELEMINSALDSITMDFNAKERLRQRKGEAREILNSVQQLPSVIPQLKTGHWVDDKCSICGKNIEDLIDSREWYWIEEQPNFCPFCGVKIEAESEE